MFCSQKKFRRRKIICGEKSFWLKITNVLQPKKFGVKFVFEKFLAAKYKCFAGEIFLAKHFVDQKSLWLQNTIVLQAEFCFGVKNSLAQKYLAAKYKCFAGKNIFGVKDS